MTEIGDNSKPARAEIIRSIKAELDEIEIAKGELSLRAKKAKGRIKAELGEKVADFNVLIRFVDLEEDPRSELNRLLKEGFAALGVGQQMNFMDAIDPQPVAKTLAAAVAVAKKKRKTKSEQIAEAVLADAPSPVEAEIAEQKAEDEYVFDGAQNDQGSPLDVDDLDPQTDIEEFLESEAALA
jgi:hypothetical protein